MPGNEADGNKRNTSSKNLYLRFNNIIVRKLEIL